MPEKLNATARGGETGAGAVAGVAGFGVTLEFMHDRGFPIDLGGPWDPIPHPPADPGIPNPPPDFGIPEPILGPIEPIPVPDPGDYVIQGNVTETSSAIQTTIDPTAVTTDVVSSTTAEVAAEGAVSSAAASATVATQTLGFGDMFAAVLQSTMSGDITAKSLVSTPGAFTSPVDAVGDGGIVDGAGDLGGIESVAAALPF